MKNDIGCGASDFHQRSSSNKAAETWIHGRIDRIDTHARTTKLYTEATSNIEQIGLIYTASPVLGLTHLQKDNPKLPMRVLSNGGMANVVADVLSRKERVRPRRVRTMAMTIQPRIRGMILAVPEKLIVIGGFNLHKAWVIDKSFLVCGAEYAVQVFERCHYMDHKSFNTNLISMANVVADVLSRKERVKPRRVRTMAMTIQPRIRGMILRQQG
ncbi:putative reverse transcriptase domain-containing protein [Tanacetum coccineum]|uniref:Reverse transcriptase domain-containing protein n=1 Tax=Tanacetum coccineum TaxID=301880 RepID=A0ABQ5DUB4_9ASTR